MTNYDVVVIGAGNGGLTAAASLAKSGYKILLLERHNIPGGCATTFCRGRFEFEVALHQLSGFGQADNPGPLRGFLSQFGIPERCEFVDMENLYRLILPGKLDITLPANREGTIKALVERFPNDKEGIEGFMDLMYRTFAEYAAVFYQGDPEASPEKYPIMTKYTLKPTEEVMEEFFKDPLLKAALGIYWGYSGVPLSKLPFIDYTSLYFSYINWKPAYVKNGSQAMSNALLEYILEKGGEVRFNCEVKKILVEDGKVVGVETEQGDVIYAKAVVSNASSIDTYVELIGEEHVPEEQFKILAGQTISTSSLSVFIGLDCEPQEVGIYDTTNFIISDADTDKQFAGMRRLDTRDDYLLLSCYNFDDPNASPPGTSHISIVDIKYAIPWLTLSPSEYHKAKFEAAEGILQRIEEVFPGFRSHIEEIEVGTPLTHMRYVNTPGGAIYGFDQYAKNSNFFLSPNAPIKGLALAGAWAGPGGFQPSLMSGGSAARAIRKYLQQLEEGK